MSELSAITKERFPGLRFRSIDLQMAGRLLKKSGVDAVVEYLSGKGAAVIPDFRPPAKCRIIAQSRPFDQWPIYRASVAIQTHINGLTKDERDACPGTSSASQKTWLAATGIDVYGFTSVQGLGLIFAHALARYDGVVVKVDNANKKALGRIKRVNERRAIDGLDLLPLPERQTAFGEDGKLTTPPGINHNVYLYQQSSPVPWSAKHVGVVVPHMAAPLTTLPKFGERLSIPKGSPGYVPEWQRSGLSTNKHRRMRAWYSTTNRKPKPNRRTVGAPDSVREVGSIPLVSRVGDDWVVFDGRGLLRNLYWRGLVNGTDNLTINQILAFFTGDPVIDTKRGVVTFIYKQVHATAKSRKLIHGAKSAQKALLTATTPVGNKVKQVGVVAIDLGQTNPVAYEVSRVHQVDAKLEVEPLTRGVLPVELVTAIGRYRAAWDAMNARVRQSAIASLSAEQQNEVLIAEHGVVERTKIMVLGLVGSETSLPWEKMSSSSTYISDALIVVGKGDMAKLGDGVRHDGSWARHLRPRLSVETRKSLNEAIWELMRTSDDYRKLSTRKLELARQCVNHVIGLARKLTQCTDIAVIVEDLNVRMFHGSGKRDVGWDEFFVPKRENRWFMQVLHKAFTDLAQHHGMLVAEVSPARTSITCPACGYCDKGNRSATERERFACLGCGRVYNADIDVATTNIRQVAISGTAMPKPIDDSARERLRGKKTKTAKK